MRSRLLTFALPVVAFFAAFTPQSHAAAVQNRITSANTGSSHVPLAHTIPAMALRSADLGPAPANRTLTTLSVRFSMTAAQQADLTQLLSDQQNPSSPSYHQWLTPEQFGARFGLSSSDLAKASSWLTSQGFAITGTARSSTFITFTGTVAQAQQAFGTSIHSLSLNGEEHISNVTDPVLPSAIAGVVTAITGLNDFKLKPRSRVSTVRVDPRYTYTSSGTTSHYIAPGDFYTIYDVNPLLSSSINGTGVTIAVMGQTNLQANNVDIKAFRAASGLCTTASCLPTLKLYGTDPGVVTGDIDEANLDVEWAGASAPSANILFVYSKDVLNTSLIQAVDNNVAPIITISYGLCESGLGGTTINSLNQTFQLANAQGITIISAAGDAGATDCDSAGLATEGLAVDFPSSSPFVTSAGGSMFSGDVSNPSAYWNTSNTGTTYTGSAKSYIPEQPWNETSAASGLDAGGAGGGGASAFFAKPAWQVGPGVPSDSARDTPDFSLNSGATHDGYIVCSQSSCTNGFLSSSGSINVFGGTSIAAPTFAGMLAMVEQNLGGGRLGNIGPNLYGLASVANVFNDITSGSNAVPCIQGTPNCPNGGSIGYNAGVGYDQASGLGSIDANNLVTNWTLGVPTGAGSTIGTKISNTVIATSSSLCAITSGSIGFNLNVTSANTTEVPTGTVQILVDDQPVGLPISLNNGTALYTLDTTKLASGGHNVSAIYSGDATFAASKGSLISSSAGIVAPIDVVSSTQPDFSITPCTGSASVRSGSVASGITFTITPFNKFTGSVKVSASADSNIAATFGFSVEPVVISSTSGVTTSFVFTAYKANARAATAALRPASSRPPSGRIPWYAAGSGATLACMMLLTLPRRRRWGALLAFVLSVAALGAVGCGGTSSVVNPANPTTTSATPGSYDITVTAVGTSSSGGTLVHSAVIAFTVQ